MLSDAHSFKCVYTQPHMAWATPLLAVLTACASCVLVVSGVANVGVLLRDCALGRAAPKSNAKRRPILSAVPWDGWCHTIAVQEIPRSRRLACLYRRIYKLHSVECTSVLMLVRFLHRVCVCCTMLFCIVSPCPAKEKAEPSLYG